MYINILCNILHMYTYHMTIILNKVLYPRKRDSIVNPIKKSNWKLYNFVQLSTCGNFNMQYIAVTTLSLNKHMDVNCRYKTRCVHNKPL